MREPVLPAVPSQLHSSPERSEIVGVRRRSFHVAAMSMFAGPLLTACGGSSPLGDAVETPLTPAPSPVSASPPPVAASPSPSPAPPAPNPAPAPPAPPAPAPAPSQPALDAPPPPANTPPSNLPSWVPPSGHVVKLTQANGGLSNHFRDIVAPYFEPFYSVKVVNDYSGAVKNPYWGQFGCTVFFGGGHAATNDNMVAIAEYGSSAISFKRVCDPTPWFGRGTDTANRSLNSIGNANSLMNMRYMESLADGKPGAPHSYGSGDIVGPEYGGATNGSYLRVIAGPVNFHNPDGVVAAHEISFADTSTPSSLLNWSRLTNEATPTNTNWSPPQLTAFVGPQLRVYMQSNDSTSNVRWFDRRRNTYVTGSGTTFGYDSADGFDSGIMFHVPSRGLLICMYPQGGLLQVQYMDVTVDQPSLGGTASLRTTLNIAAPWSAGCWCPDNNRIIVIGVGGDRSAAYEIEIPNNLKSPWVVSRAPFQAGQVLVPADMGGESGFTYKKFHYDEKVRSIVYMPIAAATGDDTVWVYRPRST